MKHEINVRNNKNSIKSQNTMEPFTQNSQEEYPFCRLICKLEGINQNRIIFFYLAYLSIENEKTLKIEKCDEIDGKLVKNQWIFNMDKIYDYHENLDKICERELIQNQYFTNFFNGFKSNIILITNNSSKLKVLI